MNAIAFRNSVPFLRTCSIVSPTLDIPMILRQDLPSYDEISLVAFSDTASRVSQKIACKGVHFFIDDYRFERVYLQPNKYIERLQKFPFVLSPDFSLYQEMPYPIQLLSVFKNRWCGQYWQAHGIKVIPTVSWSFPKSYDFCFSGVEPGSTVAISTVGARNHRTKQAFLSGYREMLNRLTPEHIICLGKPFDEMTGNLHVVNYMDTRRGNR